MLAMTMATVMVTGNIGGGTVCTFYLKQLKKT